MVLLKRLSQAIADGDPIHGVIIGTALNQDGHTNGISLPSPEAQARLVRDACADAGIDPSQIGFVEAHGTGTAVGDPIEAHALAEALVRRSSGRRAAAHRLGQDEPRPPGNRGGHRRPGQSDAGAQARADPGQPAFRDAQSAHRFRGAEAARADRTGAFPGDRRARAWWASIRSASAAPMRTSFSRSRRRVRTANTAKIAHERAWPLVLSARSEEALRGFGLRSSAAWLDERSHANGSSPVLPDLAYTLGAPAQSSPLPADAGRAFDGRSDPGTRRLRGRRAEPESPHGLHAAPGARRRAWPLS